MKKMIATTLFATVFLSCGLNVNAAGLKDIFSANYYADSYEDLYAAFEYDETKLFNHVKEYGLKEGRDVSPILDVVYYREMYPDLDAAFGDNWDAYVNHYFEYGIKEGRDNGTDFDIIRYVNSYADLREAFDEDYEALAKHYIKYGMKENRTKALKEPEYIPFGSIYERDAYGRITKEWYYATDFSGELLEYIVYEYSNNGTTRKRTRYTASGMLIGSECRETKPDGSYDITYYTAGGFRTSVEYYNKDGVLQEVKLYHSENDYTLVKVEYIGGYELLTQYYNGEIISIQKYLAGSRKPISETTYSGGNVNNFTEYIYEGDVLKYAKTTWSDNTYAISYYNSSGQVERAIFYSADGEWETIDDYKYVSKECQIVTRKYRDNSYQISTSWIDGSAETKKYRADGTLEFYNVRHIDGTYTYTQYDENGNPI